MYTITPLPFYLARRAILRARMAGYVARARRVCDFGCGDGEHLRYFADQHPDTRWTGVDLSPDMLALARKACPEAAFFLPFEDFGGDYDLIYVVAVFAHVTDDDLTGIIENLVERLGSDGRLILFEQVAPYPVQGAGYNRRTVDGYRQLFAYHDLELEQAVLCRFRFHQWFERHVAKRVYAMMRGCDSDAERRLKANRSGLFRLLSRFFVALSVRREWPPGSGFGNAWMVFRRRGKAHG